MDRGIRILSQEEVIAGALRIGQRSQRPLEDVALYYILFATGARPLEIARLEVGDYLSQDGSVRRNSLIRKEVAITGRARPLYFCSERLDDAMDAYFAERVCNASGLGVEDSFRGLAQRSRLFLSDSGNGFQITSNGGGEGNRFLCRGIHETYRKLLRYAGLENVTAMTARYTVADRLYKKGADEAQVGMLLGIGEHRVVRLQFPRHPPALEELVMNIV